MNTKILSCLCYISFFRHAYIFGEIQTYIETLTQKGPSRSRYERNGKMVIHFYVESTHSIVRRVVSTHTYIIEFRWHALLYMFILRIFPSPLPSPKIFSLPWSNRHKQQHCRAHYYKRHKSIRSYHWKRLLLEYRKFKLYDHGCKDRERSWRIRERDKKKEKSLPGWVKSGIFSVFNGHNEISLVPLVLGIFQYSRWAHP